MGVCAVPQCSTRNPVHRFPVDANLRQTWIIAINRADAGNPGRLWKPNSNSRICRSHFKGADYVPLSSASVAAGITQRQLRKGAVPSLLLPGRKPAASRRGCHTQRDGSSSNHEPAVPDLGNEAAMEAYILPHNQVGCTADVDGNTLMHPEDGPPSSHYDVPAIKLEPEVVLREEPPFFDAEDMSHIYDDVPTIKLEPEVVLKEEPPFFNAEEMSHISGAELSSATTGCRTMETPLPEHNPATATRREVSNVNQSEKVPGHPSNNCFATVGFQVFSKNKSHEKLFRCDTCDKVFRTERSVRNHLVTHRATDESGTEIANTASDSLKAESFISGDMATTTPSSDVEPYIALNQEELRRRQTPHCDVCGMTFSRSQTMRKHIREQGGSESFACNLCRSSFPLRCGLTLHCRQQHSAMQAFKCCLCPTTFYDQRALRSHCIQKHSNEKPYRCDVCGKEFLRKSRFPLFCSSSTSERSRCHICGETFPLKSLLQAHRLSADPEGGPFSCDVCEKSYAQKSTLALHYRMHAGVTPYSCGTRKTGSGEDTTPNLRPIRRHESSGPHKCNSCGKTFPAKGLLMRHYRSESCEKPFKCDVCGGSFLIESLLTNHRSLHTGDKPFKCDMCEKSYTTKRGLDIHVSFHTGEKPHRCETCGKAFVVKHMLDLHNRMHTGKMMHRCGTCGQAFVLKNSLKRHSCARHREKPHRCETCGKLFSTKQYLKKHHRIHTGKLPFQCETCGRLFNQIQVYVRHRKTHARGNPAS